MTTRDITTQVEAPAETAIQRLKQREDVAHDPAQDLGPDSDIISSHARERTQDSTKEFMASIWQVKESRAKTAYPTVSFKFWHQPDNASIKTECAAITELNTLSDVPTEDF
ncbi:hypothetical protein FPOAC1_010448 [Fusarium poae]|uniref:hypothetical protein n=1 Tax=Fusarium poae TaxID=36050 RepID=UPI001CEA8C9A|nr:hypothetical protein FPOAC1_010448 [Fusarium poae]KAG8665649.1 hypothetical protein FPOAC1_010448 [Fusarium poae]